ncbi:MAG TPA: HEAT repeat domain-containing protein [Gemmatimonadaceae bacterium]|jgi:HEAT repeat protein|nr:HEAT repeat domain-containing protein [Gemmatimonadaceae bacterium]
MNISRSSIVAGALVVTACLLPGQSRAQSIASRVNAVRDGKVRMTYASRPDLCGWGNGISNNYDEQRNTGRNWSSSDRNEDVSYDDSCSRGPVRLVITKSGGQIDDIRASIGGRWRANSSATDIGAVSAREVVDYLFALAESGNGRGARKAVFPATLADSVNVTQRLYDLARNDSRDREARDQAVFWLGQQEDDRAVDLLENILKSSRNNDIRDKAIFALSQHRSGRGFGILRSYAEDSNAPEDLRGKAIFWLGQRKGTERFNYLRGLYARLESQDLKDKVIFAMSQQKDEQSMKWLVDLASNSGEPMEMRKKALFWAGQSGNSSESLVSMYDNMREREMKDQMIFVLSQRRDRSALDKLMSIARNDPDREMRRKAMFWLGQSKDPRVASFLTDIITR